jgi:hypothetical protein
LVKHIGDKIYVTGANEIQVLNSSQEKLILLSRENRDTSTNLSFLPNTNVLKESTKDTKQCLKINGIDRKNSIVNHNPQTRYNANHVWMWNGWKELVIDDKIYDLNKHQGNINNQVEVSEDGNMVAIDFNYNEQGEF